jgi:hypothetical protein
MASAITIIFQREEDKESFLNLCAAAVELSEDQPEVMAFNPLATPVVGSRDPDNWVEIPNVYEYGLKSW